MHYVVICCSVLRGFTHEFPCCYKCTPLFRCHSLFGLLQSVAICCGISLMNSRVVINAPLSFAAIRFSVCCSVLQFVAVCCRVLWCVAVYSSVLKCVAVYCSVLECVVMQCGAVGFSANESRFSLYYIQWRSVLQCVAMCCSMLQYGAGFHS